MEIEAVIFDMDGLLLDTENLYITQSKTVVEHLGYHIPDEVYLECVGSSHPRTREILVENLGKDFPLEKWEKEIHHRVIGHLERHGVNKKQGVERILRILTDKNVSLAVASSTRRKNVEGLLNLAGIIEYFSVLLCGDEVENGKPHPEIFIRTAEKLSVHPESCLVFEDSFQGIRAAHAAGMRPVMIPDLRSPGVEIFKLCFRVCASLDHAADIISELLI